MRVEEVLIFTEPHQRAPQRRVAPASANHHRIVAVRQPHKLAFQGDCVGRSEESVSLGQREGARLVYRHARRQVSVYVPVALKRVVQQVPRVDVREVCLSVVLAAFGERTADDDAVSEAR